MTYIADIFASCATFAPAPPAVPAERILRIHGYTDLERVRPAIVRTAKAMAALAATLTDPIVAYRHVPIASLQGPVLELAGGIRLHCRAFARQLAGCHEIVPFVLTLGERIPREVVRLVEATDLLEGLLLETAGWLCIEDATRQFKTFLRAEAARAGLRITSRMGPGYSYKVDGEMCRWPLEENAQLFRLFGNARLPVQLLASSAMTPKMSRSGLYGIATQTNP